MKLLLNSKMSSKEESIYIVGRYNKFSRNLCQTPWIIDGVRRMESSVQDLIVNEIEKRVKYEKAKFSACGREDVDVRMLGDGRPFVVELMKPEVNNISDQVLDEIEQEINTNCTEIKVRDLQLTVKEEVKVQLKLGETDKTKRYRALCCINRPLTEMDFQKFQSIKDLTINQKTPIRVLHRRSLLNRPRVIHRISAEKTEDDHKFIIELTTEAGTYIKEFVHGDFGRSTPNLAEIMGDCRTDIIELDVIAITMDWPKTKAIKSATPTEGTKAKIENDCTNDFPCTKRFKHEN
ncbi:putative tRNA pseudouridine synthase Pus10 [Tetranychus urticae]|uniref:putative tRNA pseudouridine synthase Pus10 n=1 Tax=Tetranychus urticae TaxID=32264 RepID=UPI00077C01A3|nr:putative tRNA pseudouridine synthase Pus10 [Tetranychus urticae]XP_015783434.1 putative tRNA pseudouridine synthase Pus10 [Tetranychus urticae]